MEIIRPIVEKIPDNITDTTYHYERDPVLNEFYEKIEKDLKEHGLTIEDVAILNIKPIVAQCN
jgi:hypothetical protein